MVQNISRMRWLPLVILSGVIITYLSCSEESGNPLESYDPPVIDTVGPRIISTTPDSGEILVVRSVIIEAVFSEPLDPSSINDSTIFIDDSTYGTVTYSENRITLTLNNVPGINSLVRPRILASVRDTAGNQMQQDYGWIFRTSPEFGLQDLIGDYTGIYTATDIALDTNVIHRQPILWVFTDSTFAMRIDTSAVIDTTLPTCRVNGLFSLDNNDLNLQITQAVPDTAAGFTSCDPRRNPEGPFLLYRITPFAETIEFRLEDSLTHNSIYKNIKITKTTDGI